MLWKPHEYWLAEHVYYGILLSVKPSKLVVSVKAKNHQPLDGTSIYPINTIIKIPV